ncbi:MAG: tRNA (N(6)-L-threonylcarbamoyladenosine(37)-C(2))-methylthiotransferase MtaB [Deltaproteobacteria bacterium CG12_big_fil_rev_8_21_14_0_65_43_10]|nr:MAG: tRNA (N(6)-L-threonylcarbamoyladenosine(37)-C(2))-methylthiotransferase MtaB [Deltaproteobacteria bacterium CG2_30_43_15]PIQ45108.1 MAG: tRNA (N(6)-L-threonylcarbamoyladenosine(37)-C(2))-methylthiotransferase MtaB [Deltaproteobacteria bacterium CG12_big_fil_rev_8_21_14_0_65_43_10]PIU84875.1 MAG: tRNA (N(6)-L-threonylcarbamoyladenosine(37)-C(2))-methylthiotransferase MtaB [Deltaproteobacteria bacterium CG06_land_8_20_14_3_00_44_19]PIX23568.1 MAG: tRNA (N(6)-L-threonylcarbamoyladenosine(37
MKKIAIATLGCKVNKYDSAVIHKLLEGAEYSFVPFDQQADIYIVNTCTVTKRADYQSRQLIRRSHRLNQDALIIVTGCYAQRAPQEIKEIQGVDYTVGVGEKGRIVDLINGSPGKEVSSEITNDIPAFPEHTRAFLKVQDGCDSYCSYCVVPYARGRSKSLQKEETIRNISKLTELGYREIVLTGIHLGSYGWDLMPPTRLSNLLRSIEHEGISCRIRLSSIEPTEFDDDLIDLISSSPIICNHLHIPLQSGADEVLKRMNRPYSSELFKELVKKLVSAIPDLNIGVDVIVGFPGESHENFTNTVSVIEELPIGYLHVFPYSRRPGTPAADFPDQVDSKTIKNRGKILRGIGNRKREEFYRRFLGKRLSVLIESKRDVDTKYLKGFSRNYIPVLIDVGEDMVNEEIPVTITKVRDGKVFGLP